MIITKQYIKILILRFGIYCLIMLGVIALIDAFDIQYTIANRLFYCGILALVWIWLSNEFEVYEFPEYTLIYEESLRIWKCDKK